MNEIERERDRDRDRDRDREIQKARLARQANKNNAWFEFFSPPPSLTSLLITLSSGDR